MLAAEYNLAMVMFRQSLAILISTATNKMHMLSETTNHKKVSGTVQVKNIPNNKAILTNTAALTNLQKHSHKA